MHYNNAVSNNNYLFISCVVVFNVHYCSAENKIDKQELKFLMTGGEDMINTIPNPASTWLPDKNWDEFCRLNELNAYNGIQFYTCKKNISFETHKMT